jgi:hypothetical protein
VPTPASGHHHRLKHDLAWGSHNGQRLEQWQYEVTGGGRVWYLVNHDTRTVWLVHAGTGHPKLTTGSSSAIVRTSAAADATLVDGTERVV